jgi:hypothetical protein
MGINPREIVRTGDARSEAKARSVAKARATIKQVAYHRIARAGGWGLLVGGLAGIIAACVHTLLTPWQLVAIGTSLGTSLDYLGLMPSAYRRNLVTKWAKHYDQLVKEGYISDEQRKRQIEVLLLKHGP